MSNNRININGDISNPPGLVPVDRPSQINMKDYQRKPHSRQNPVDYKFSPPFGITDKPEERGLIYKSSYNNTYNG